MPRISIILAMAAVSLTALRAAAATEIVDGVAAIVNDRVITYSDVQDYVQPVVAQLRRSFSGQEFLEKVRTARVDALNALIDRALIVQEFNEKGFKIPENVAEAELNEIIAQEFGGDRAAFVRTLQAQNMTLSQYRERLRERIIIQAMRARKAQQHVIVSPHKIEKYYQENVDLFKVGDQIKLRMIFVQRGQPEPAPAPAKPQEPTIENAEDGDENTEKPEPTDTEQPEEAVAPQAPAVDPQKLFAEELVAKLEAGDSFESLARVYSAGKEGREGGDWGWIGRDVLRKELNDVAFSLPAGQNSRVIETPEGYYIVKVEDILPAHLKPLAEVRDLIEKNLLQQQRAKVQEDWIKELRAKAYIRMF